MPEETTAEIDLLINTAYDRFNARDIDAALALMTTDVQWPSGAEGGFVQGHHAVREYWEAQWKVLDPHLEATAIDASPDGRVIVSAMQKVKDLDGNVVVDGLVAHIFTVTDGRIERMEIVEV